MFLEGMGGAELGPVAILDLPDAQGKVTKWNQVDPSWPDAPIKLFGAGADSGTFDYFTEAIVGKAKSSRGDYTASFLVHGESGRYERVPFLEDVPAASSYACPMHPWITSNDPSADCSICGMKLVKSDEEWIQKDGASSYLIG